MIHLRRQSKLSENARCIENDRLSTVTYPSVLSVKTWHEKPTSTLFNILELSINFNKVGNTAQLLYSANASCTLLLVEHQSKLEG
jgi:hypothetical protein